ncbi:dihydrolipoyl dehydrogenase [Prochlorococcus sp. AH-716-G10]|nr:dihydrolipoyl dehydrogenase [Prochlorococcus sp. AH-716-G10]
MTDTNFDFDLIVIGAGYGGFDAAKHAAEKGLKVAIIESGDMGGTCVNKGCVPSKALLAASGKVREIANYEHLAKFGIHTSPVRFERSKIADHANNLVSNVRENLTKTLKRSGVEIILGFGRLEGNQKVGVRDNNGIDRIFTCKNTVLATGSSPFVPPGITLDSRTVFTSDEAVKLEWLPRWIAIIGSGYIGLEFADVYTALGCEVTMIEALENIMPTFDPDITKIAKKNLIQSRDIDTKSNVFATKITPGCPVKIELTDAKSKEIVENLEVDGVLVATGRSPNSKNLNLDSVGIETIKGYIPIDDQMRVLNGEKIIPNVWAVGDVTGKLMLAHTAAAQGTIAVENICGENIEINYMSIPAATFTHPEISSVGLSENDAKEVATKEGFTLGVVKSYFKANSKALAELESDGILKLLFNKDSGKVLGAHIFGMHAADLIQEIANAISRKQDVMQLSTEVHTHPTLSEVVEVAYKQAASQVK